MTMVIESWSTFFGFMAILLSPMFLLILLYSYEDIGDFFYNVKIKTHLLFSHSVFKHRLRVLKKFYEKYYISVDLAGIYYNSVFKTCFPKRRGVAKFKREVKKFLREANHKKTLEETVNNIVKLKYETHFWGSYNEHSKLLNNRIYKGYEEIAKKICSLTLEQLYLLHKHNITAIRYADMTIQGYTFEEVVTWGDMPYEWVEKLEPKNNQLSLKANMMVSYS